MLSKGLKVNILQFWYFTYKALVLQPLCSLTPYDNSLANRLALKLLLILALYDISKCKKLTEKSNMSFCGE